MKKILFSLAYILTFTACEETQQQSNWSFYSKDHGFNKDFIDPNGYFYLSELRVLEETEASFRADTCGCAYASITSYDGYNPAQTVVVPTDTVITNIHLTPGDYKVIYRCLQPSTSRSDTCLPSFEPNDKLIWSSANPMPSLYLYLSRLYRSAYVYVKSWQHSYSDDIAISGPKYTPLYDPNIKYETYFLDGSFDNDQEFLRLFETTKKKYTYFHAGVYDYQGHFIKNFNLDDYLLINPKTRKNQLLVLRYIN